MIKDQFSDRDDPEQTLHRSSFYAFIAFLRSEYNRKIEEIYTTQ